ncbi:hypothetical protein BDP27DRAFT_1372316 [Rhodocollybia butyracea]|uniref:Uncharacterized protein n=1 Tax=Rhodocollybia butyracea TaxID=206335 RepID=A0A9P5P5K9_9AGAR|nr:hypothetical protein BDP27DRAFT_1372316 [Rhodocollybia butyracea]
MSNVSTLLLSVSLAYQSNQITAGGVVPTCQSVTQSSVETTVYQKGAPVSDSPHQALAWAGISGIVRSKPPNWTRRLNLLHWPNQCQLFGCVDYASLSATAFDWLQDQYQSVKPAITEAHEGA